MTPREALEDAIQFAQELLDGPGDNPGFFEAWRKTQAEWKGYLERGEIDAGLAVAMEKVRKIGVEAGDWEEHVGSPYSGQVTQYGRMSDKCFRRLDQWRAVESP